MAEDLSERHFITIEEYFGAKATHPDATPERRANAELLLTRVNQFLEWASKQRDILLLHDRDTGTLISGSKGGAGDGGFRLQTSSTGAARSRHKEGEAVDIYDPNEDLDQIVNDGILARFDLYREHPTRSPGWIHLQAVAPPSRKRTFYP
jgi:hypothetical protein